MEGGNRSVDLLNLLRGPKKAPGLRIIEVCSTEPAAITFKFEGTALALAMEIFEVPVGCYPLRLGDRFLAYPLIGEAAGQRWALIGKINDGPVAFGQATNYAKNALLPVDCFTISGIDKEYPISDLTALSNLSYGQTILLVPTLSGGKIKYIVVQ